MTSSKKLWGLSTTGNVYTLSTQTSCWQHIHNQGQVLKGFKRVCAGQRGAWGLGCDHQVYVFVEASDVPIRCQATTFENERWVPSRGWSWRNLVRGVDPWEWSSEDGHVCLPRDAFTLPSESWVWESDWSVDENVKGFLTDKGGWRYSNVDFRGQFTHQKTFKSCVRRRKWVRHYKYITTDVWARIPSLHVNPLEEPIVDLATGGHEIPNQPEGFSSVWVVTIDGRVLYRAGVCAACPEGQAWVDVPIEDSEEVLSLSVGASDLVWAVTWAGGVLVRAGVSWSNPRGERWLKLEAPDPDDKLVQVAVGDRTAWVISVSGNVWMRKGIKPDDPSTDPSTSLTGSGWLHMVHKMRSVSVGPLDRVWAVDYDTRQLYFRQGVSPEEPSGRTWAGVELPHTGGPRGPDSSSQSVQSSLSTESIHNHDDYGTLKAKDSAKETAECEEDLEEDYGTLRACDKTKHCDDKDSNDCKSAESPANILPSESESNHAPTSEESTPQNSPRKTKNQTLASAQNLVQHIHNKTVSRAVKKSRKVVKFLRDRMVKDILRDDLQDDSEMFAVRYSPTTSSLEHLDLTNEDPEAEDTPPEEETSPSLGDSLPDNTSLLDTEADLGDLSWLWVSATVCCVQDEGQIKHWLHRRSDSEMSLSMSASYQRQLSVTSWRDRILSRLSDRRQTQQEPYSDYTVAIDRSVWVKKAALRWWRDTDRRQKWTAGAVELTQDSDTREREGTFTIQYTVSKQPKHQTVSLADVTAVTVLSEPGQAAVFGLHLVTRTTASPRQPPLRLMADREEDMEDWVAALSHACCDYRGVGGMTQQNSSLALTERGDVFVHEPVGQFTEFSPNMFWRQQGGHLKVVETCPLGVTWGLGYDSRVYVYTRGYGGAFFKGMSTSPHGIFNQTDSREMFVYENQRWRPISGYTDRVLFTDTYKWSDESGKKECTKDGTKLPSMHWTWSTDWMVDRRLQSGVDKDGWQYGRKLNRPFYSQPRINSVIRRRRWVRKCTTTTSGPWEEVPPHPLIDISLQIDPSPEVAEGQVALWGVGVNGEMLYRMGVTPANPQGVSWVHVPADLQFVSVSVGGASRVWAVARDGSAWLRHGITADNPIGDRWLHVSPPDRSQLTRITAGGRVVWAINTHKELFCRKGITPTHAEGTEWVSVCKNISHVSCGAKDQVWAIQDSVVTKDGRVDGVLCRRGGLAMDITKHGSWDCGIGGGWSYVTVRGWLK